MVRQSDKLFVQSDKLFIRPVGRGARRVKEQSTENLEPFCKEAQAAPGPDYFHSFSQIARGNGTNLG